MEHYDYNELREKARNHSLSAKEFEIYHHMRRELGRRHEEES